MEHLKLVPLDNVIERFSITSFFCSLKVSDLRKSKITQRDITIYFLDLLQLKRFFWISTLKLSLPCTQYYAMTIRKTRLTEIQN